jgi:type II secretory pathway pseudopilin PulG
MEVMVAVVVVGVAITVISQGFALGTRSQTRINRSTEATLLAAQVLSEMETGQIDFTAETEGEFEINDSAQFESQMNVQAYAWEAEVEDGGMENLYRVTLTVSWTDAYDPETADGVRIVRLFYKIPQEEEEESSGTE